jgi:hypothetical protein
MRASGLLHPQDMYPVVPDTVQTFLMTGGSSAQASDWATSTGAVANAGTAGVGLVAITALTTAGASLGVFVNLMSTGAAVAAAGTSIASTGVSVPVIAGPKYYQVPGGSTGFSIASHSSGNVMIEMWKK